MPGLTVAEKNHWKDRLSKRIDRRIETIAAEEPNLLDRVKRDARERAMRSLSVAELQADVDAIEKEEEALSKRKSVLHRTMLARVRRVPLETIDQHYTPTHYNNEVENAIKSRQAIHEDELLAECEIGRRILTLRREEESLLDCVWLASSPIQVRGLWSTVSELFGDEQTQLHCDALTIPPVQDGRACRQNNSFRVGLGVTPHGVRRGYFAFTSSTQEDIVSHVVRIQTEVRDATAVFAACRLPPSPACRAGGWQASAVQRRG